MRVSSMKEAEITMMSHYLHYEVHKSLVVIAGYWCVWTHHKIPIYAG